jgi:peptidase E
MRRKLIAIGGGGFLMEPDNPLLDLYFLQTTGKPRPKICLIPTASGDAEEGLERFYTAFAKYSCEPSHLTFFRKPRPGAIPLDAIERDLLEQDAIYVGGGSTRSMLAVWREWGLDRVLHKTWQAGILLGGVSAGAICWFQYGVTDSILGPGRSRVLRCLSFLPGSCAPHFDGEPHRRADFHALIAGGQVPPGIGIDDGAAVLFEDEQIKEVVASRPQATAHRVTVEAGVVVEEALVARYLGGTA